MNALRKKKIIILAAVAIVAAVCGYWLLTAPSRERAYVESAQEAMMEDLMRDIREAEYAAGLPYEADAEDVAVIYEETPQADVYYPHVEGFEGYESYGDYAYDPEMYAPAEYSPPPARVSVFADPIPDNAFPANIVGIGILSIESINLRLPIADDIEYATLRIAPGRVPQTAQIGDIGNAVIAGHRNYAFGSMFNRLGEVEIGDIMQYQARNGELMMFEVFEIAVIEPENQIAFLQPTNDSIITLYTCTPIRAATHRLIIRAQRIS
jgi:sortase A